MVRTHINNPQTTLVFSILAGPVLWAVQFLTLYSLAEFGCRVNSTNLIVITPTMQQGTMLGASVFLLMMLGGGAWQAWRIRARLPDDASQNSPNERHTRFLATTALALALLFGWVMVVTIIPIFVLPVCDGAA